MLVVDDVKSNRILKIKPFTLYHSSGETQLLTSENAVEEGTYV
jgi:hypothetical protein